MDEKTLELLNGEVKDELEILNKLEIGTDNYKIAVDGIGKLLDRQIEIEKINADKELKAEEAKTEKRDRLVKNVISGVGVVGGFAVTIWGTLKSIEFEKEGTITTIMGRGFINKLLPKK
ncbi:MAG: hypothetical protein J6B01_04575 [Ruminococcus sp.]|nr:hypothetical protein [Ruminococcus sp.]